jgi:hypothetical protein
VLISLHLPKTAGSSFLTSLEQHYDEKLFKDYADIPINSPAIRRNSKALVKCIVNGFCQDEKIRCIHGHFLPLKYLLLSTQRDVRFVTWMRDPVERLASHYFYWMRTYVPGQSPPLHKRMIIEKWSLERFCLGPELQNIYCQFFWGFPLSRFDFIGITEFYESEFEFFSREFLGGALHPAKVNINLSKEKISYFENEDLVNKIKNHHSKDIALYEKVLDIRLRERPDSTINGCSCSKA